MQSRSLGWHNPTYWWGNFLLFDHAPRERVAPAWLARFEAEIALLQPESRHITFGVERGGVRAAG